MFGWGYVKDFCISLFKQEQKKMAIDTYNAECLRIIAENTARLSRGSYLKVTLSDILNPKPEDNRTGEEIVDDIIKKAGLEVH